MEKQMNTTKSSQTIFTETNSNRCKYWNGLKNKVIRMYFYVKRGLELFNEFRYLIMLIFGLYLALKLTNPIWFIIMFLISIPVLIFSGWIAVHHVGKVVEYLNVEFSTHFARYQFDLQERIVNALEEINQKIGKK